MTDERPTSTEPARAFPAFAARRSRGAKGHTWWGRAWTNALEDSALAQEPMRKGRACANSGRVGPITVGPGRIAATVHDADGTPYETVVRVERFTDAQWDRFLDQVAAKAGHLAALVERDMPRDLVSAAEDADVPLLPGIGELDPECDCPDWELPCTHAAALSYQAAWLLDADPFVLLLIRGLGERAFLDRLRERDTLTRVPAPAAGSPESGVTGSETMGPGLSAPGVTAREAYRPADPLPADPPPVPDPVAPARITPPPGIPAGALESLVAEAARRARELLAERYSGPVGGPGNG
ncbi:SWIM zinc finger family protein [Embleya sp. NPDC001921]